MAWWCQGERGLLGSKSSSVWPLHPSLAFFFSFCLSFYSSPSSAFNLASSLSPPLSLAPSLFIFSPNLSIRSVDKLFMPLSVPEALSPLLHSPAPLLPLLCRPHPFLPLWPPPPPLMFSSLRSTSSSAVTSSLVLRKARPHTI